MNFKNVSWQGKTAIVFVSLLIILEIFLFSKLQHLPSPIYGGDLYGHYGFSINYLENGLWTDPFYKDEYSFYPWFGNLLFILISFVTGMSLMSSINYYPVLLTVLASLAYYFLGKQIFKDNTYALLTLIFYWVFRGVPDSAPNNVPWMFAVPLFFYFWLKSEESSGVWHKILSGIFLGIASLGQIAFFLSGLFIMLFTVFVEFFLISKQRSIIVFVKKYFLILFVGFIVSLPFYGVVIYQYHFKNINPVFQFNGSDIDNLGVSWWFFEVFRTFFNFGSIMGFVQGMVVLLGLIISVLSFKSKSSRLLSMFFLGSIILPLHHLITRTLFNSWVLPGHLFGLGFIYLFLFVFALKYLSSFFKKYNLSVYFFVVVLLFALISFKVSLDSYNSDRWVNYGRNIDASTQNWLDLGDWIKKNTNINTVFLAFDESCFALHAVSGRKCVIVRRTHANYFVDVDERLADAVVILYGNDSNKSKELLERYGVEYFLVDPLLFSGVLKVHPKYKDYLMKYNVSFKEARDRIDISVADARQFDLLLVPMQNINSMLTNSSVLNFDVDNKNHLNLFSVRS